MARTPEPLPSAMKSPARDEALAASVRGYAGPFRRLGGIFLDWVLLTTPSILIAKAACTVPDRTAIIAAVIALTVAWQAYHVILHWRLGRTLGKMVLDMRITGERMQPLSLRMALLRSAPDIALFAASATASLCGILAVGEAEWAPVTAAERGRLMSLHDPSRGLLSIAIVLWWISEPVSMLFTARRQAVQDLLAGTVVWHVATRRRQGTA